MQSSRKWKNDSEWKAMQTDEAIWNWIENGNGANDSLMSAVAKSVSVAGYKAA